eukprot:9458613-Lingulodinium_polyedra.AAC.1
MRTPVFWRAHGACERAICESPWRRTVESTAPLHSILKALHNDAVESAARRRNGSQIAHSRTPCKH